jgi:hypothetical protein
MTPMCLARAACVPAALLLLSAPVAHADDPKPADTRALRAAVARGLAPLLEGSRGHIAQKTCFACHNQAVPLLALTTARARGFDVPADHADEQATFIADFLDGNRENYLRGKGQGGQADTAAYALWTLELAGRPADETTAAVVEYLLLHNKDLPAWRTGSNRPPSEASNFTVTFFSLRALHQWGTAAQQGRIARKTESARTWLVQTASKDNEDRVFRLWALREAGAGARQIHHAAQELAAHQRPDGGWGQLDGTAGDAYATGSALTALHLAAGWPTDHPVYRRGAAFLLGNQRADGTWYVKSRSKPFQPYYESGFPHGKDQFISMAASAWAVTALALACPPGEGAARRVAEGEQGTPFPYFGSSVRIFCISAAS